MGYGRKGKRRYSRYGKKGFKQIVNNAIQRNVEKKLVTYPITSTFNSIGSAWSELNTLQIGQGTQGYQRVGRKIAVHSIQLYGTLAQGSGESLVDDAYNTVRLLIGLWKSATPCVTAGAGISSVIARDNSSRNLLIRKYYDRYIPLVVTSTEKGGGDGYTPQLRVVKYYKKFYKPLQITFGDDSNTYASGFLVVSMVSDSIAVVNPGFTIGYIAIRYSDA